ncbi:MAG: hypothetical protein ABIO46_08475 [Chitinophagales bacterium]
MIKSRNRKQRWEYSNDKKGMTAGTLTEWTAVICGFLMIGMICKFNIAIGRILTNKAIGTGNYGEHHCIEGKKKGKGFHCGQIYEEETIWMDLLLRLIEITSFRNGVHEIVDLKFFYRYFKW